MIQKKKNLAINQWKNQNVLKLKKSTQIKKPLVINLKKKILVLKHQKNLLVVNLKKKVLVLKHQKNLLVVNLKKKVLYQNHQRNLLVVKESKFKNIEIL